VISWFQNVAFKWVNLYRYVTDEALIDEVSAGNFSVMERDGKIIGGALQAECS
jgi:hypothetical protein